MAKYYYDEPNGKRTFIKEIDYAQGKIEFTNKSEEALEDRGGYYATPTKELIARLFVEEYPCVANLQVTDW